ncbi:MAG: hypothetical protein QOD07_2138 [Frankiaceae bacterium]|nr:hypothetical protein [Frankiaceae bacterium]
MIHLRRELIAGLEGQTPDPAVVRASLQSAIELEHSTIPLYLYALYSLDEQKNGEICSIIESVVVEEMLHMTLAANTLNALGGRPVIDAPGFLPTYPGPLPGGVQAELSVSLAPFSMGDPDGQLETFLTIEEPERPIDFPPRLEAEADLTIGEFYATIAAAIAQLGDSAFVDPPRNQVGPDLMHDSVVVVDVATATTAIRTIVEQGEGTSKSPSEGAGDGRYAHYYRFNQIKEGHLLEPTGGGPAPDDQYAYDGAAIPFHSSGVYPVQKNPGPYPGGSVQSIANDNFNYTYTSLLRALHALFNGMPTQAQLDIAIGLMMSLKGQAKAMMSGVPDPGVVTGPTFEYQPTNPA